MSNMGIRGATRKDVGGDGGEGLTGLIHCSPLPRWALAGGGHCGACEATPPSRVSAGVECELKAQVLFAPTPNGKTQAEGRIWDVVKWSCCK